jgi:hypothetical protein
LQRIKIPFGRERTRAKFDIFRKAVEAILRITRILVTGITIMGCAGDLVSNETIVYSSRRAASGAALQQRQPSELTNRLGPRERAAFLLFAPLVESLQKIGVATHLDLHSFAGRGWSTHPPLRFVAAAHVMLSRIVARVPQLFNDGNNNCDIC